MECPNRGCGGNRLDSDGYCSVCGQTTKPKKMTGAGGAAAGNTGCPGL